MSAGLLVPCLASCAHTAAPSAPAHGAAPLVVDTDMSSDDIMALSYLLERHGVSLAAITVDGTGVAHGTAGARNVLRLVQALAPHRDIPVAYGPPEPLSGFRSFPPGWRAAADGMYGLPLPRWDGARPTQTAVRLLIRTLSRQPRAAVVVALGPLTNLALALRADPGIARHIAMVYAMAGAVRTAGNEPVHQQAEWNVYVDASAARQVLRSGVPVTMVPLDASNNVPITPFIGTAARAQGTTAAIRLVATLLRDPYYTHSPVYFWDPLAAVAATSHRVVSLRAARLAVGEVPGPTMGTTRLSAAGSPVRLAVSADAAAFDREFLATLNGGQPVRLPVIPASRQLRVSYDGTTYAYQGPASTAGQPLAVRLANRSPTAFDSFQLVLGRLGQRKGLSNVQAVIRRGHITKIPRWFRVAAVLPGPQAASPTWGVTLTPGHYALVCISGRTGALHTLAVLKVW